MGSTSDTVSKIHTKLIEQLKPEDVDGKADIWTMSPPCQPFTNTLHAKHRDIEDRRCKGFLSLMNLLDKIKKKPLWIMLENVKTFSNSKALDLWRECLTRCGYTYKEILLSPVQFGIPNHRMRFYMICEHSNRFVESGLEVPSTNPPQTLHLLKKFILNKDIKELEPFLISRNTLQQKWAHDIPVVT